MRRCLRSLSRGLLFAFAVLVIPISSTLGQTSRRVYVETLPCAACRIALVDSLGAVLGEYACDSAGRVQFRVESSGARVQRIDLLRPDGVLYRTAWTEAVDSAMSIVFSDADRLPVAIEAVRVSANSTAVRDDGRTVSYRVQDDALAQTLGTTEEVLRRVPMVSVTADGTPLLRGGSNVKVLLNGKELVGVPNAQVLAMVNPADLERVEVQTVPSARYATSGVDGVINLVTKRKVEVRTAGMLNVGVGSAGSNLMGVVTQPLGKGWSVTATTGNLIGYNRLRQYQSAHLYDRITMSQAEEGRSLGGYFSGGVTTNYANDAHQASVGVWVYHSRLERKMQGETSMGLVGQRSRALEANTSYLGGGRYTYSGVRNLTVDFSSYGVCMPVENVYATDTVELKSAMSARGVAVSTDVSWRALRQLTLEAGGGYTHSWYTAARMAGEAAQNGLAHAYAGVEYSPWRKLSLRAGGRYEYYMLSQAGVREFHNGLFDVSASLKFSFRSTLTVQYSRRSSRPSYAQLTPAMSYSSLPYVQSGNAGLTNGLRHRAEATYSHFVGSQYIRLGAYYEQGRGTVMRYAYLDGVIRSTFVNGDSQTRAGGEMWLTLSFLQGNMSFNIGGGGHYVALQYGEVQRCGGEWTCSFNATYRFLTHWQLALFGSYVSPRIDLQGSRSLYWYSNLALYRSFLDDKLRVALSGDNLFTYPMRVEQHIKGVGFSYEMRQEYYNMGVRLLLTWRFGKPLPADAMRKGAAKDVFNSTL